MDGPTLIRPLLPDIPRAEWAEHPHFPSQVLLLGSHENFRRISQVLIGRAEQGTELDWAHRLYVRWISAMRSHEAYEEFKLYPFLEQRWDVSLAEVARGHQRLHDADRLVRRGFNQRDEHPDGIPRLAEALRSHDGILREHLEAEEDVVIPGLLGLTPHEFNAFYGS